METLVGLPATPLTALLGLVMCSKHEEFMVKYKLQLWLKSKRLHYTKKI